MHAVLVWGNAAFHSSRAPVVPVNITLLPPYSPELYPVEDPWHYLRSHRWFNRWHADYEAIREAEVEGRRPGSGEGRVHLCCTLHGWCWNLIRSV